MSATVLIASLVHLPQAKMLFTVWLVSGVIIVMGGFGVVLARNAVHSALMLIMALFGVAVMFLSLQANFLAAVQVIVYAGAIVVLFLFVIMFLGVDREEDPFAGRLRLQWPVGLGLMLISVLGLVWLWRNTGVASGAQSVAGPLSTTGGDPVPGSDVAEIGRSIFTTYLFSFEATAALLVIAVVGAVVLARRPRGAMSDAEPDIDDFDDFDPDIDGSGSDPSGGANVEGGSGDGSTGNNTAANGEIAAATGEVAAAGEGSSAQSGEDDQTMVEVGQ